VCITQVIQVMSTPQVTCTPSTQMSTIQMMLPTQVTYTHQTQVNTTQVTYTHQTQVITYTLPLQTLRKS